MRIEQKETFNIIMNTVNTLVDLVKLTFGPNGNKVITGKGLNASALDDGVQIAKELELDNEAENYVLKIIREVAVKTNDRVGDGTTGSLIILQAILKEVEKNGKVDGRKLTKELKKGLSEAIEQLKKQTKQIKNKSDLEKVARVSFDDEEVAKLLSEIIYKIGADGLINVESSTGFGIEHEMIEGFEIKRGYLSPYMITDKEEAVLENPYILVSDSVISTNTQILPVLEKILASRTGRGLVILSKSVEGEALSTLILNKLNGKIKSIAVNIADYDDISILTGANAFMSSKGDKGAFNLELSDLGGARRVVSKKDSTVIIGGKGNKDKIQKLKDTVKDPYRLAQLSGLVAVIKVGANTDSEAKALTFKIEDASNAVKVAYKHGIVKGAGVALMNIKTSSEILNKALQYPHRQLIENIGSLGEFEDTSIIDPVQVLIAGLESAVSIACLLCTVKGIIVEEKTKNNG